jgi:F-type H+-transporting ATPase subunit b
LISVDLTLIIQWLNFIILLVLLHFILFKPLMHFVDERNERIRQDIEIAKEAREAAERIRIEHQEKLNRLKVDMIRVMEEVKARAAGTRDAMLQDAHNEADRIIEGGLKEVRHEIIKIKGELKQEVAGIAVDCASQVLEREIKEEDHKKLVQAFLDKGVKE